MEDNLISLSDRCLRLKIELRERVFSLVVGAFLMVGVSVFLAIAYKQTLNIIILLYLILVMPAGFVVLGMMLREWIDVRDYHREEKEKLILLVNREYNKFIDDYLFKLWLKSKSVSR